jgi:hypothetical protein
MTTETTPRRALGTVAQQALMLFDYLVGCAADCRVITYGMTEEATGIPANFQGRALDHLYDHALVPLQLPPLTALVVKTDTGRPGAGGQWSGMWDTSRPVDADQMWRMAVAMVITYPSWQMMAPMVGDRLSQSDQVISKK